MRVSQAALKAATRRLVEACGGQESAALIPGMPITRHQSFSEAGLASHPDRFLRIDVAALLEADCGVALVTAEMAKATSHALVKLPDIPGGLSALGRITAQALKEVSDVFSLLGTQLEDGVLSAVEGEQLDREVDEAIAKLLALKLQAIEVARKDKPSAPRSGAGANRFGGPE